MCSSFKKPLFSLSLVTLLYGCGPDSDDSSNPAKNPVNTPSLPEPTTITDAFGNEYTGQTKVLTGKAIDGYLKGALVCLDINANGLCDSTDPDDLTDSEGNYSLDVPVAIADLKPNLMVLALPGSTIDSDSENNQAVESGYSMSAPWDSKNITPLTTMVVETISTGLSQSEAEDAVKRQLNLELESIDDDYIALKDDPEKSDQAEDAHDKAQMLVEVFSTARKQFDGSGAAQNEKEKDKGDMAYHHFIRENNVMAGVLSIIEEELSFERDGSPQSGDQQITIDIDKVQKSLIDEVRKELQANSSLIRIAQSYQQPASDQRKAELLKEYLANGYYYNLAEYDDDHSNHNYGYYDQLSLSDDSIFTLTEWVYSQNDNSSEWIEDEDESDAALAYKNGEFKELNVVANGVKAEFDDKKGNVRFKEWGEIITVDRILDLSDEYMALALVRGSTRVPASILDQKFPEGSESISLTSLQETDEYRVDEWTISKYDRSTDEYIEYNANRVDYWVDGVSTEVTSLDDLLKAFKFEGGLQESEGCEGTDCTYIPGNTLHHDSGMLQFDLGEDDTDVPPVTGSVYLYKRGYETDFQNVQLSQKGTWYREKLPMDNGEESEIEIVRVELPEAYKRDDGYFFVALPDEQNTGQTIVRNGVIKHAGTFNEELTFYNKEAMDAIKKWIETNDYNVKKNDKDSNNSSDDQVVSPSGNAFLKDIAVEVKNVADKKSLADQYFSESYYLYHEHDMNIIGTVLGVNGKFTFKEELYRDGKWQAYNSIDEDSDQKYAYNETAGQFQLGYDSCDAEGISYQIDTNGMVQFEGKDSTFDIQYKLALSGKPLAWATYGAPSDDVVPVEMVGKIMPEGSEGVVFIDTCATQYRIRQSNWEGQELPIRQDLRGSDGMYINITRDVIDDLFDGSDQTEKTVNIYKNGQALSQSVTLRLESLPNDSQLEDTRIIRLELPQDLRREDDVVPFFMATEDQNRIRIGHVDYSNDEPIVLYNQTSIDYIKEMIELMAD